MTTDTDTYTFSRDLALPPARLWPLLTDADMRAAWGSPDESMTLTTLSTDVRVGGTDHHRCGPEDAPEFEQHTRWYHLDEPSLATYTEVIQAGGMAVGASLVTIAVAERSTGSTVHVTVAASSFVGPEMMAEFEGGWTGAFENLVKLAEGTA